ncbi:MAG TPA: S49 family peptidase [Parachlamydiaceae bacterium]|nr:S49 family peptidase [Parachlamydiaceae bacterium]
MRQSFFFRTLRYFFIPFFVVFGIFAGIYSGILLLSSGSNSFSLNEIKTTYTPEITVNANGVRKNFSENVPVILKLNISGVIGSDSLNRHTFQTQLLESREGVFEKAVVKALLLHINSPGGTVVDADGIYLAVKDYKEKYQVPVFAYVDGLCASGGMYIAAAADKIYASDVSLIGSVGVVTPPIFNFSKTIEKLGAEALTLSAGIGKDNLNSFRPWKTDESTEYQKIIDHYYTHFVNIVASSREGIGKEKLVNEYGAHVFSAKEAKECGFIDEASMNLSQTLDHLSQAADINHYQVIELEKKNFFSELFASSLLKGKIEHKLDVGVEMPSEIMNQFLYLYRPGL